VPGYPITPALFIALVVVVITLVLMARPLQALAGITVVLCGLPAYRFLSPAAGPAPAAHEVER
ncbi:MAG: hypothetical protein ACRD1S_01955, partial [Vicinamibacterales bacterium]